MFNGGREKKSTMSLGSGDVLPMHAFQVSGLELGKYALTGQLKMLVAMKRSKAQTPKVCSNLQMDHLIPKLQYVDWFIHKFNSGLENAILHSTRRQKGIGGVLIDH